MQRRRFGRISWGSFGAIGEHALDDTIAIYRRLRSAGFTDLGVVIPSDWHRSATDVRARVVESAEFRFCTGIYNESLSIADKDRQEFFTR